MQTSWRAVFLVVVAAGAFHLAAWQVFLIIVGYSACDSLDHWLAKRAKTKAIDKAIDDELFGWETDPDDLTHEDKDKWSRVKLTGTDQIIVTRVAELLRRALR